MERLRNILRNAVSLMHSQRGRDLWMFLIFVAIAAVLWIVLTLNEEEQHDLRMPIRITQQPDSVTLVSTGTEALSVSLQCRGTQLMKMAMSHTPTVDIDFRIYRDKGVIRISNADLKALVRNAVGGAQVNVIYPDSLIMSYSTQPGFSIAVVPDYRATAAPQSALVGKPHVLPDSVKLYVANGHEIPTRMRRLNTEPILLDNIKQTTTVRAKLITPPNTRAIPDSVDVMFQVEPMIFKKRKVVIDPINVPHNTKLITFPAQIEASFMVPMSVHTRGDATLHVVADYNTIRPGSGKVKLSVRDISDKLYNVQLSADSAEYIIEHL